MENIQVSTFSLPAVLGNDIFYAYRPAYDSLRKLPTQFPGVPLMALTATATSSVRLHLKQLLGDPVCEISSVNKTNITYQVFEIKPQGTMYTCTSIIDLPNHYSTCR